ncbi:hypothetical protein EDC96DRAFT_505600 [Choanephora cucurbitarum]|nr:hypothetical protein EDC96DRAFT_505600 [Choanephora cucurbitarum]
MKSFIILSLLIASVSAGCNCKPSEQACIDTCVKTANACVTQCNIHNPSKECINGCIAATWPTSITLPDQKVALNTTSSQMPIGKK